MNEHDDLSPGLPDIAPPNSLDELVLQRAVRELHTSGKAEGAAPTRDVAIPRPAHQLRNGAFVSEAAVWAVERYVLAVAIGLCALTGVATTLRVLLRM